MHENTSHNDWKQDLLICLATTTLLWIGPLTDLLQHPESPLWFPFATMPDFSVYVSMFRRAALDGLTGDPFTWEHRMDPGSVFSVYNYWPSFFGFLIRIGGDVMIPFIGWLLSTLWFFGLFRFCKGLGQSSHYAFFVSGLTCFFSVNLAYNLNGYKLNVNAWNFAITEHLRSYPTVSSMAVYTLAIYAFYMALVKKSLLRITAASFLIGFTALGRPFDWMVLETAVIGMALVTSFQKNHDQGKTCLQIILLSCMASGPILWKLADFQSIHRPEYYDQMWRGILQAKSLTHYAKYTFGLVLIGTAVFGLFRWALGPGSTKTWPLHATFPIVLVAASLLPHYRTLLSGITITGFAYFFVFSFATWFPIAIFQALWLYRTRRNPSTASLKVLPAFLLILIVSQQLGLGFLQRERLSKNIIPAELRQLYRDLSLQTPSNAVILSFRNESEMVSQTGRWSFSPTPSVAAMLTSTPTHELLSRALWSEYIFTRSIDSLEPLFAPNGLDHLNSWLATQPSMTQQAFQRLQQKLGTNSFIFHPQLNRYDLKARKLTLPTTLSSSDDFVVYFPENLRRIFYELQAATRSPKPMSHLPFKLDMVLVTPDFYSTGGRNLSEIGFVKAIAHSGFEAWKKVSSE